MEDIKKPLDNIVNPEKPSLFLVGEAKK